MTTRLDDLLSDSTVDPDDTLVTPAVPPVMDDDIADDGDDDLFDDDALLAPRRTSRLTLVLVALLILVVGFFIGVQVERLFGATSANPVAPRASTASASASPGG